MHSKASVVDQEIFVPSYGSQITVQSLSDKNAAKMARKERKREAKRDKEWDLPFEALFELDCNYLSDARQEQVSENAFAASLSFQSDMNKTVNYPHIYDHSSGGSILSAFGTKFKLPARAERREEKVINNSKLVGL
jgi:hypothetical protein